VVLVVELRVVVEVVVVVVVVVVDTPARTGLGVTLAADGVVLSAADTDAAVVDAGGCVDHWYLVVVVVVSVVLA